LTEALQDFPEQHLLPPPGRAFLGKFWGQRVSGNELINALNKCIPLPEEDDELMLYDEPLPMFSLKTS